MQKRIFYVIYFDDSRLQHSLDAMRFIANPKEKTPAHVTVRGPYHRKHNFCELNKKIAGMEILAKGTGAFFNERQNTVFIACHGDKFREVWKKQDFDFNPHITIYDGSSRDFAEMLFDRLSQLSIQFRFMASKLTPLVSYQGQYSTWLKDSFDEDFAEHVIGQPLRASDIASLSSKLRISLIESFAHGLSKLSDREEEM